MVVADPQWPRLVRGTQVDGGDGVWDFEKCDGISTIHDAEFGLCIGRVSAGMSCLQYQANDNATKGRIGGEISRYGAANRPFWGVQGPPVGSIWGTMEKFEFFGPGHQKHTLSATDS